MLANIAGISHSSAQQVIATGGGYYQTENIAMSFTIGEPVTETFIGGDVILTQGFQQPYSFYLQQILNIPAGWSGVSTWLDPLNKSLDGLFAPAANELIILASMDGFYYPAQSVNTPGNWNYLSGYQAKAENAFDLAVTGTKIPAQELTLSEGWNLIPVLSSCDADVEDLFSGFSEVQIVKEVAGTKIYWPAYNINTLENLMPGRAYFVAAADAGTITFPACTKSSPKSLHRQKPENTTPWNDLSYSAISHVVAFPAAALQHSGIRPGDVVGAFTPDGFCAGRMEIQHLTANTSITVFADDALTGTTDGYRYAEPLRFQIYRPGSGETFRLSVNFNATMPNTGYFADHGISAISSLKLEMMGSAENPAIKVDIYPNPSQGVFNLTLSRWPQNLRIQITDMRGSIIKEITPDAQNEGAVYPVHLPDKSRGIYFLQLTGDGFVAMEKVVVQ